MNETAENRAAMAGIPRLRLSSGVAISPMGMPKAVE
jgi:hypothetical protein